MKTVEEVRDEFVKELVLPKEKEWPKKQMILAPVGLPGTGKTTVVRPMSEALGLVRVSSDEFRKLLKENGHGWGDIKDLLFPVDEDLAKKGYSIAFDADTSNPKTVEFIKKLGKQYDMQVFWIRVHAPEEFVFEKFRKHAPSWLADDPQKMIDNYNAQKERKGKENLAFDFIYTFDTSQPDLDTQIEKCIQTIQRSVTH